MNTEFKRLLDSGDDGRAFTDAVLLKASGALYRRRQAAETRSGAWTWLEQWARPWLVTALLAVAVAAAALPLIPAGVTAASSAEPASASVLLTVPQADDMLVATIGN